MMLVMTTALMLTAVAGFLAGKEYDRMMKIAARNRRLRREEDARMAQMARTQRKLAAEKRKFDYMYSVKFDAPGNGYK